MTKIVGSTTRSVGWRRMFGRRFTPETTAFSSKSSERMTSTDEEDDSEDHIPLAIHHTAFKTRNITLGIEFYGLFGFEVSKKFRTGPARAAWLEQKGISSSRIELIEVPSHMLNEPEGMKRRALDLFQKQELLGLNHLAMDVTSSIQAHEEMSSLSDWIAALNKKSLKRFGKTLRVALDPQEQLIGSGVFEIAFLYDADGALIELLHYQNDLPQSIDGWEWLNTDEFDFKQ